jgi:hypothetical protein
MRAMKIRHRLWVRRFRILALPVCALALAFPASAPAAAQQDLRSPDARDAARADLPVDAELSSPASTTVIESSDSGDQTVPIVLAGGAIGIALAGLAVAICALFRRPRARWTVG